MFPSRPGPRLPPRGSKVLAPSADPAHARRAGSAVPAAPVFLQTGPRHVDDQQPSGRRIGVFLVDDHEIVRRGVRDLLESQPDIVVVGEAGTAEAALADIPALRPD